MNRLPGNMTAAELFNSEIMRLPKSRPDSDYELYLASIFQDYQREVAQLTGADNLAVGIRSRHADIQQLSRCMTGVVRASLNGRTDEAHRHLESAMQLIGDHLRSLYTNPIDSAATRVLYRMTVEPSVQTQTRHRLFHVPMHRRHLVGQHRYGIPGFPCLYLGGSLRVCQMELGVQDSQLPQTLSAAFELRSHVRVLNFAYRPAALHQLVFGSSLNPLGANPTAAEDFLLDYATCWPLLAACSICALHPDAPFRCEYIVPQLLLQWIRSDSTCEGIRFFSTRWDTGDSRIFATANYSFPAKAPINGDGFSQPLVDTFSLSDPHRWVSTTGGNAIGQEMQDNTTAVNALPRAPLPPLNVAPANNRRVRRRP